MRIAPADIAAEQALLGAVLINNDAMTLVAPIVQGEHFFEPIHRTIFDRCLQLISEGRPANPVTLNRALPADIGLGHMRPIEYLAKLATDATTVVNAPDYAETIRDLAMRRNLIALASEAVEKALDAPIDDNTDDHLAALETGLHELRVTQARPKDEETLGTAGDRLIENAEAVQRGEGRPVATTGFDDFDRQIGGGYRPGRLIVLAGRPGAGKTVIAVASARRIARRGFGAAIMSLEIDAEELTARVIASEMARSYSPIAYRDILGGNLSDDQMDSLREGKQRVEKLPFAIDTASGVTMAAVEAKAKLIADKMRRQGGKLAVLFIDYLGLVSPSDRYKGRRVDEAGEVAKSAKDMAGRLGITVVLLSQLNRAVEGRDNKRPTKADLRDSGNIEEHADVVGLLYRPAYYIVQSEKYRRGDPEAVEEFIKEQHTLELILDKNRLGPTSTVRLWCDVGTCSVDNMARFPG